MEADWNKKMNLIHTRCLNWKSSNTHLTTDTSFCTPRTKQLFGSVSLPGGGGPWGGGTKLSGESMDNFFFFLGLSPPGGGSGGVAEFISATAPSICSSCDEDIMLSQQTLPKPEADCWGRMGCCCCPLRSGSCCCWCDFTGLSMMRKRCWRDDYHGETVDMGAGGMNAERQIFLFTPICWEITTKHCIPHD